MFFFLASASTFWATLLIIKTEAPIISVKVKREIKNGVLLDYRSRLREFIVTTFVNDKDHFFELSFRASEESTA